MAGIEAFLTHEKVFSIESNTGILTIPGWARKRWTEGCRLNENEKSAFCTEVLAAFRQHEKRCGRVTRIHSGFARQE